MTAPAKPKVLHVYRTENGSVLTYDRKPFGMSNTTVYLGEYAPRGNRRREQIGEWWEVHSKQCKQTEAHDLADAKRKRREMRRDGFIGMLRIVHVIRRKVCR